MPCSLLQQAKALLPWEIVCDEMDWDMDRSVTAGARLDQALRDAGLALRETRNRVAIVPKHDLIDVETTQTILRRYRSRRTLGAADARQLLQAVDPVQLPLEESRLAERFSIQVSPADLLPEFVQLHHCHLAHPCSP